MKTHRYPILVHCGVHVEVAHEIDKLEAVSAWSHYREHRAHLGFRLHAPKFRVCSRRHQFQVNEDMVIGGVGV